MVRLLTFVTCCLLSQMSSAQELGIETKWYGSYWTLDGERARKREFYDQMKSRPEAYREFKKWEEANGVGGLMRGVGAGMVLVGGLDENWTIIGISLGVFVGGMALIPVANKKMKSTVEIFNNSEPISMPKHHGTIFRAGISADGIGLVATF